MKIKRVNEFKLNEEISYEQLGMTAPTYSDNVRSHIHYILSNERGISEKDFRRSDELTSEIKEIVKNDDIIDIISEFEQNGKRKEYCAETIYDNFIK